MPFRNLQASISRFDRDERGEVTTQQLMYLAIGAIVAAVLYKYGGTLLKKIKVFIDGIGGSEMDTPAPKIDG